MSTRLLTASALAGLLVCATALTGAGTAVATPDGPDGAWSRTRTLTREFANSTGLATVDSRTVTVSVDKTTQLQGRERVRVSWSGAHPSGARAANPFGEGGLNQEYPVVILQCRGLDDPSLPDGKQVTPSSCWTSTRQQRSLRASEGDAIWTRDLHADDEQRQVKSGLDPYPAQKCEDNDPASFSHITPFQAAKGTTYPACTGETMPPEAAVGASFPPAEQAAFTDLDGRGSTQFEVRSEVENESLGCSEKVRCSLVVIPIMGLSCAAKDPAHAAADRNCRRAGSRLPGSSNFGNEGVDATVSPTLWWAASNWRNRFSVPLDFALPPGACDVLDSRPPTAFFGSELLAQAAVQWAPAYCLRKDRFKWQQNAMPDDAAFALMEKGDAVAATVSGQREPSGTDPVAYAPTAVTGFAISYVADRPENAGEYADLRLNARLIAKLLTESYPATDLGAGHPGLEDNPRALTVDPEFRRLNPGLTDRPSEAASTLMSLSTSSDVISSLSSYLAQDADVRDFIAGKPDPWGMRVNPSYKGLSLPLAQWPLLDTFVPKSSLECYQQNPAPYLPQVAAPVGSLHHIATAVLDAWPLVATQCSRALPTDPWKLGRVERQGMGTRFLLGLTTLGDAARFGLRTARLQTRPGVYVGADDESLAAAVALARPGKALRPFTLEQADLVKSGTAYPGTMVVYSAARTRGVPKTDAAKVAQFIEVSTTEGQVRGRGNGQLAEGYLPIRRTGVTAKLFTAAQAAAKAIRAQRPAAAPQVPATPGGGAPAVVPGGSVPPGSVPAGAVPDAALPEAQPAAVAQPVPAQVAAKTVPVSSRAGGVLLPALLGLGVLGAVLSAASRLTLRARGVR